MTMNVRGHVIVAVVFAGSHASASIAVIAAVRVVVRVGVGMRVRVVIRVSVGMPASVVVRGSGAVRVALQVALLVRIDHGNYKRFSRLRAPPTTRWEAVDCSAIASRYTSTEFVVIRRRATGLSDQGSIGCA